MPCTVSSNNDRCVTVNSVRDGIFRNGKTVVLAGDHHPAGRQFLHRVVTAMMAELHFHRFRVAGQPQQLVSQANTEGGDSRRPQSP